MDRGGNIENVRMGWRVKKRERGRGKEIEREIERGSDNARRERKKGE